MVNCRLMNGLDWRTIGYAEYSTMLAQWNVVHDPNAPKGGGGDPARLERFMAAHTMH
jgi:hypothetical protein